MAKPTITVEQLIEDTTDLPVMPAPILRVMHLAGEPGSSAAQLAESICAEPSLAARVLKFANSAYYGMSGEVTTIQGSVVLLGIKTVRNLAMMAAAHSWFSEDGANAERSKALWEHAIGVAAAADAIATLHAPELANEAFCSGLLHDVGKTIMMIRLGNGYDKILEKAVANGVTEADQERAVLGFDHAELGAAIAKRWNLPERLQQPIRHHHSPSAAEPTSKLADIIHIADVLYWRSAGPNASIVAADQQAFQRMGLESVESYDQLVQTMLQHQQQLEQLMEAA